jgi:YidC/Oxa1 family membrane protein insertase
MSSIKYLLKIILYKPLFNALIFLVWLTPGHNVAWAIIILTIIIRIILLPSSLRATRQQKRMRDLQPEITALQDKYKGDKQEQAKQLMDFYKRNDINPLGSCLPLLIQLPILIILYYVFRAGLDVNNFNLLYGFTPRPETIKTIFFGINLAQPDKYILPIIAGILQFIQAKQITPTMNSGKKGEEMQAMISKQMLYLMPIFTVFIAGRLPAALPLYWVVTNAFSIVQQWWVFKDKSKTEIAKPKEEKKKPSLAARLLARRTKPIELNKTVKKGGVEVTIRRKGEK